MAVYISASGIGETFTECDKILDEIILEIDETIEQRRAEADILILGRRAVVQPEIKFVKWRWRDGFR